MIHLTADQIKQLSPAARRALSAQINQIKLDRVGLVDFVREFAPEHYPVPQHLRRLFSVLERASTERVFATVSLPPRNGKTVSIRSAIAWLTRKYPDRLNGLVMYSADMAKRQSNKIRKLAVAAGVRLDDSSQRMNFWATSQGGGLACTGIESGLTGEGFGGLMVCDDILRGRQQAESVAARERAWDTFRHDAFTRLQPPVGSCVVVGTRWHEDDVIGRIHNESGKDGFPQFEDICLPAIADDSGEPTDDIDNGIVLWPERFDRETLRGIRSVMGPYGWWSLYQGKPRPKGGHVFSEPTRYERLDMTGCRVVLACDPAGTESSHSDYTAAVAIAVKGHGREMTADVIDVFRERMDPGKAAFALAAWQQKHGSIGMSIEASRDGKALAKALRQINPRLRIYEVVPRGSKFIRSQPLAAAWGEGRVRLPISAPWITILLDEFAKFTGAGDKHDDIVDAMSWAWTQAQINSVGNNKIELIREKDSSLE